MNSITNEGLEVLKIAEGFQKVAYWDVNGWAIGYGNHYYSNGSAVQQYDTITKERAESEFLKVLSSTGKSVMKLVKVPLSDNQFTALVMYTYNRGIGSFGGSTLMKMVNKNPNDSSIPNQFVKEWGTNQEYKKFLIERRAKEAEIYAKGSSTDIYTILKTIAFLGFGYWLIKKYLSRK